jgi:hypothetical protein
MCLFVGKIGNNFELRRNIVYILLGGEERCLAQNGLVSQSLTRKRKKWYPAMDDAHLQCSEGFKARLTCEVDCTNQRGGEQEYGERKNVFVYP